MEVVLNFILFYARTVFAMNSMFLTGAKGVRARNRTKKDEPKPNEEELRQAICDILKEVDFNTVRSRNIIFHSDFSHSAHFI